MLEHALKYLSQGFNVFPIKKGTKEPALKWEQFQHQRVTSEQVKTWFEHDLFSIAIVTGEVSGVVVVDIDPAKGGNVKEWLSRYPTDSYVMTGSGGAHLFYQHPGHHVNNYVGIEPGVDIRADGGYVVAAPSLHPVTKKPYRWISEGSPASFPETITQTRSLAEKTPEEKHWITGLLEYGAKEGQRNDSLAKLAGYFCGVGLPQDVALQLVKLWNGRNENKLDLREIETTIRSVYKTASKRVDILDKGNKVVHEGGVGTKDFTLMGFEDFMKAHGNTKVDWLVPTWVPDKTIAMVVSPPGSFKTWMILDLAVSVATGTPFLGKFEVENPGPVFLIQQEDFHGQTAERIAVIRKSKLDEAAAKIEGDVLQMDIPAKMPLYIHPDRQLKFDDPNALKGLAYAIEQIRPRLVIIDPLYSTGETDDYMAKTVEHMFVLKDLRDKFGCTFVIAHHTNKSDRDDRMRAWGSQFLNAFLETGWQIFPKGKKSIKVKRHFKSSGNPEEICLSFNIDSQNDFTYEVVEGLVEGKKKNDEDDKDEVVKVKKKPSEDDEEDKSFDKILDRDPHSRANLTQKMVAFFRSGEVPERGVTAEFLSDKFGFKLSRVTNVMTGLVDKGIAKQKISRGTDGRPTRRYWSSIDPGKDS